MGRSLWYVGGGVVHLLDFVFFPGCVIPTDNGKFNPNRLFPWMTWERFAKGRTLVGVDEDDEDFATAGLELGEKEQVLAAAIGATNNNPRYIGYKDTSRIPKVGAYTYSVLGSDASSNVTAINHGTAVKRLADGEEASLIQPSTTVYYWRRVS